MGFKRATGTSLKSLHDGPRISNMATAGNGTTEALPVVLLMSAQAKENLLFCH
jgi:hypothetical protein